MTYDKAFWLNQAWQCKDELIHEILTLISFRSVFTSDIWQKEFPFGSENAKCLQYLLDKASSDGFITRNHDNYAGVIQYGSAKDALGIVCHLDVVDAEPSQWKHDPFTGIVRDGVIYGRGSNDDKGPTMAAYMAMKIIARLNIPLRRSVHLILGCNEESGMKCMDYYLSHETQVPDIGFVPDGTFPVNFGEHGSAVFEISAPKPRYIQAVSGFLHKHIISGFASTAVVPWDSALTEAFEHYLCYNGLEGNTDLQAQTLRVIGKSAHGSRPHESVNATKHLINFLACHFHDEPMMALIRKLFREDGVGLNIAKSSYRFGTLSIAITGAIIENNLLRIFLDCRYPTDITIEEIMQKLNRSLCDCDPAIALSLTEHSEGFFSDPQSYLPQTLLKTYRTYYPQDPSYGKVSAGDTYARKFKGRYLGFGPTTRDHLANPLIGQAHQPDEGMDIETLLKAVAVYCDVIYRLAG